MKMISGLAFSMAAAVCVSGCMSSGTAVKDSTLSQFQKGVTTEAQIEKALGPPQMTSIDADGNRAIAYFFTESHANGASYIPVVGLFAGGAKGQSNMVHFTFDHDSKLLGYESTRSAIDVRTGIMSSGDNSK